MVSSAHRLTIRDQWCTFAELQPCQSHTIRRADFNLHLIPPRVPKLQLVGRDVGFPDLPDQCSLFGRTQLPGGVQQARKVIAGTVTSYVSGCCAQHGIKPLLDERRPIVLLTSTPHAEIDDPGTLACRPGDKVNCLQQRYRIA